MTVSLNPVVNNDPFFDDLVLTEEDLQIIQVKENEFLSQSANPQSNNLAWQWRDTSFSNLNAQINKLLVENDQLSRQVQTLRQEQLTKCGEISILRQRCNAMERECIDARTLLGARSEELLNRESEVARAKEEEINRLRAELEFKEQELFTVQANLRSLLRKSNAGENRLERATQQSPKPMVKQGQSPQTQPESQRLQQSQLIDYKQAQLGEILPNPKRAKPIWEPVIARSAFLRARVLEVFAVESVPLSAELIHLLDNLNNSTRVEQLVDELKTRNFCLWEKHFQSLFSLFPITSSNSASSADDSFFRSLAQPISFSDGFFLRFWTNCLRLPDEAYLFVNRQEAKDFNNFILELLKCPLELTSRVLICLIFFCKIEIERFAQHAHHLIYLIVKDRESRAGSKEPECITELFNILHQYVQAL